MLFSLFTILLIASVVGQGRGQGVLSSRAERFLLGVECGYDLGRRINVLDDGPSVWLSPGTLMSSPTSALRPTRILGTFLNTNFEENGNDWTLIDTNGNIYAEAKLESNSWYTHKVYIYRHLYPKSDDYIGRLTVATLEHRSTMVGGDERNAKYEYEFHLSDVMKKVGVVRRIEYGYRTVEIQFFDMEMKMIAKGTRNNGGLWKMEMFYPDESDWSLISSNPADDSYNPLYDAEVVAMVIAATTRRCL